MPKRLIHPWKDRMLKNPKGGELQVRVNTKSVSLQVSTQQGTNAVLLDAEDRAWLCEKLIGTKLWKLERVGGANADEMRSCIVRAPTEPLARKAACTCSLDEGEAVWRDPAQTTCQEITLEGGIEVLLTDSLYG